VHKVGFLAVFLCYDARPMAAAVLRRRAEEGS
jgi:hypothetical protein